MIQQPVRPYSVWSWFALPLWCLVVLIMFPPHQLDIVVSSLFFDGQGFFLKNNPLFAIWLYTFRDLALQINQSRSRPDRSSRTGIDRPSGL